MSGDQLPELPIQVPDKVLLQALQAVATTRPASSAARALDVPLGVLAGHLTMAREHYRVESTAAALREARRLGHLLDSDEATPHSD